MSPNTITYGVWFLCCVTPLYTGITHITCCVCSTFNTMYHVYVICSRLQVSCPHLCSSGTIRCAQGPSDSHYGCVTPTLLRVVKDTFSEGARNGHFKDPLVERNMAEGDREYLLCNSHAHGYYAYSNVMHIRSSMERGALCKLLLEVLTWIHAVACIRRVTSCIHLLQNDTREYHIVYSHPSVCPWRGNSCYGVANTI